VRSLIQGILLGVALLFGGAAEAGVNINTASQSELETLPGIGPSKAVAIIQHREAHGPFKALGDLDAVTGIGPATLTNLNGLVEFGDGAVAPSTTTPAAQTSGTSVAASPAPAPKAAATSPAGKININSAALSELEQLPGIGPSKAQAILRDREERGPFTTCADLDRVEGIGPATVTLLVETCVTQ
jgi:competence protein ComEA